ncbi:hypothetical protein M885DRAFT_553912 [Pelagophyceae sp. CCMP2097]|nr:hypothetical protein M885DRAFT_553912 [Pelagophyceae sp. CCMP2097]
MSSKGDKAEASEAVEASEAAPAEGGESLISRLTAGARNVVRLRLGAVGALRDAFRLWWFDVFGRGAVIELPADKPALCTVADVDEFGDAPGKCCVYRFALAAGPGAALPLDLGQELEVAVLDEKNRMVRASFPLASSRFEPGFVEICAPAASRRDARVAVGGLAPSQRAVVDALDARGVGGDVAVKPGKRMFEYEGRFVPITSLQCFVEDLGALPVIQLLKESLPRGRSTVATAQVFWVNESEDDFALYNALEALYYKFSNKMEISCIVDDRVHEDDSVNGIFARNPELDEVVEPWMPGKLAVVAGPAKFATQVSAHLTTNMGYPAECVIRLTGDGTAAAPL